MNPVKILGNEIVIKAAIEASPGTPESLTSALYLPAIEAAETSETPTTVQPILSSPDTRNVVAYSTDNMSGGTAKTFMFSGESWVEKQLVSAASLAMFLFPDTMTASSGATFVLGGVTCTMPTIGSAQSTGTLIDAFYDYVVNGTASGGGFTFSGTWNANFDLRVESASAGYRYMLLVPVDPLYASAPPSHSFTGTTSLSTSNVVRTAHTGSGTQINIPALYPYLAAAGLAPAFTASLGLTDAVDSLLQAAINFHVQQDSVRSYSQANLKGTLNLLAKLKALKMSTALETAVGNIQTAVTALKDLNDSSWRASNSLKADATATYQSLATKLASGQYKAGVEAVNARTANMNGKGYLRFSGTLLNGNTVTINGYTYTASGDVSAATVATAVLGASITNYTQAARLAANEVEFSHTTSDMSWSLTATSNQASFKIVKVPPLQLCYNTSATAASIAADIDALMNEDSAIEASFNALKSNVADAFSKARSTLTTQKSLWTQISGTGDLLDDLAAVDLTADDLTFVYREMACSDTGILNLAKLTLGSQRYTESGVDKKVILATNVVVSSFDLNIMANQPPEVSLALTGSYFSTTYEAGDSVSFNSARLGLMPSLTKENITFISFVGENDVFINGNVTINELALTNLAGLTANRVNTTEGNFHRLSADKTNRKATITLLDAAPEATEEVLVYKELIGQRFKFRLQVGDVAGFTYLLNLSGVLTNDQPTQVQNSLAARQLELTVTKASLVFK